MAAGARLGRHDLTEERAGDPLHLAPALADVARHVYVRQEVHLDLDDTVALAGLAPPTFYVERETPRLVAARLRLGQPREPLADRFLNVGQGLLAVLAL